MGSPQKSTLLKSIACIIILSLPFITLLQTLGPDSLLDSYRHPTRSHFLKGSTLDLPDVSERYLVTEEPATGTLKEGDTVLYHSVDGMHSGTVSALSDDQGTMVCLVSTGITDHIIPTSDIVGRVHGSLDDNPWSLLTLQVWDLTIHTLNPCALLPL